MLKTLSKIRRRLGLEGESRDEPVVEGGQQDVKPREHVEVVERVGLKEIAFAAATKDNTMVIFMGAAPLSYTLGLLLDHSSELCEIVRNMAARLALVSPKDRRFLDNIATHGGAEPNDVPFIPVEEPVSPNTPYVGELSFYEVALMAAIIKTSYVAMDEAGMFREDPSFKRMYNFWDTIWNKLPDHVKMGVTYTGGTVVN